MVCIGVHEPLGLAVLDGDSGLDDRHAWLQCYLDVHALGRGPLFLCFDFLNVPLRRLFAAAALLIRLLFDHLLRFLDLLLFVLDRIEMKTIVGHLGYLPLLGCRQEVRPARAR